MKAAIVHDFNRPLTIEDVPMPEAGPEQVLARAAADPPKSLSVVDEGAHTGALAARGMDYEKRVLGYSDAALLP
jgi:hypothetical protein